jgi:DNA-binding MarR family transcriptional regulator
MVLRILEGYAASGPILVYLLNKASQRAYRKEIEHEMYLAPLTAIRTLDFLTRISLVTGRMSKDDRVKQTLTFYSLTEKGRRIAQIFNRTEDELEAERSAGTIPADLEG